MSKAIQDSIIKISDISDIDANLICAYQGAKQIEGECPACGTGIKTIYYKKENQDYYYCSYCRKFFDLENFQHELCRCCKFCVLRQPCNISRSQIEFTVETGYICERFVTKF